MLPVKNRHAYQPGQIIFREGEFGNSIYIVEKGQVEIWRGQADARVVLGTIKTGGVFGEMAIFDEGPRLASASAVDDAVLIRIPSDRVRDSMKKADPILEKLIRVMLDSTRSMAGQIEAMALEKAGILPRPTVHIPTVKVTEPERY